MGPQERESRNRLRNLVEFSDELIRVVSEDIKEQEELFKKTLGGRPLIIIWLMYVFHLECTIIWTSFKMFQMQIIDDNDS